MKAVIQRVHDAELSVGGETVSKISNGMTVYFGVAKGDAETDCEHYAKKIANLRIFEDDNGKMNLSVKDISGEILLISQFTLLANTDRGNRPDFFGAEAPDRAKVLYEYMGKCLEAEGIPVKYGVFGADMTILQSNAGPVTIIMELPKK